MLKSQKVLEKYKKIEKFSPQASSSQLCFVNTLNVFISTATVLRKAGKLQLRRGRASEN